MGWVKALHGQTVGLDTAPVIYFIERHAVYIDTVRPFFVDLAAGRFRAVTSTVTLLEVLINPMRLGDEALAHQYNDILLSATHISTLPVTAAVAQLAADLRARHNLRTADAIQLAIAMAEGATAFLTNDHRIPDNCGINILQLDSLTSEGN